MTSYRNSPPGPIRSGSDIGAYTMIAVRDLMILNALYPVDYARFIRLQGGAAWKAHRLGRAPR